MASIPVMCMVCGKSIKDSMFPQHMQSVHGGMSQNEAINAEKNIPVPQSPIVLDKDAPPSPEFMEMAKMLDGKPEPKKDPPVAHSSVGASTDEQSGTRPQLREDTIKPIKLEYRYSGQCKDCKNNVETLIVKVKGQTVAVAFCTRHGQLAEREVVNLEDVIIFPPKEQEKEQYHAPIVIGTKRKEVKKRGKQSKHKTNQNEQRTDNIIGQ